VDAQGWNERYAKTDRVSTEPNPLVVELTRPLPSGRALDLAAGEGRHALWLAHRGWDVTAVDFSEVGIDKGRRAAEADGLSVEWVVADVRSYRPRQAFDLVLITYYHPDFAERPRAFSAAAAAVAPGGHLLVVGRHAHDMGRDGGRGPRDAARRYTPEQLAGAFPGIELTRCEPRTRLVESEEGPIEITDVLAFGVSLRRPSRPSGS
jgi:SAM-dependent methyltransferase